MRGGLGRAKEKLVVGDGIAWIWNLKANRWSEAKELLDFLAWWHLWNLGRACKGMDEDKAKPWVQKRLHGLRHGQEQKVLKQISSLKATRSPAGKTVQKEKNYFAGQTQRMKYKEMADRGWPIGSGAVESSCRQDQCRFKRPGQSWTGVGFENLSALDEARRNDHWEPLWLSF